MQWTDCEPLAHFATDQFHAVVFLENSGIDHAGKIVHRKPIVLKRGGHRRFSHCPEGGFSTQMDTQ
jgi:hypothetical protein